MNQKFVTTKKAKEILGIHQQTLYNWEKKGKIKTIRTAGGQRMYNVDEYLKTYANFDYEKEKAIEDIKSKLNICYVRVSTLSQKDDLERQKKYMKTKYPKYVLIEDIGSGINFNRKGFRRIIKYAIGGKVNKLVVAFKDRLTRFGFDFISDIVKEYSDGTVIIDDEKDESKEPKEELVEDVLQILNVYTAKLNGLRKYSKKDKKQ
jgi:predicted site-specific integrase-resolvase